jgi:hypothetical protein
VHAVDRGAVSGESGFEVADGGAQLLHLGGECVAGDRVDGVPLLPSGSCVLGLVGPRGELVGEVPGLLRVDEDGALVRVDAEPQPWPRHAVLRLVVAAIARDVRRDRCEVDAAPAWSVHGGEDMRGPVDPGRPAGLVLVHSGDGGVDTHRCSPPSATGAT